MKNKQMVKTIIIALIVGAAAFYGGMKYQQSRRFAFGGNFGNGNQMMGRGQGGQNGMMRNGFQPVNGEIISSDDKSITVKMQDGSTKIILFSDSTNINKAEQGSKSDLTQGTKVLVFGQTNSDGSVTAQSIQLNPTDRMMIRGQ